MIKRALHLILGLLLAVVVVTPSVSSAFGQCSPLHDEHATTSSTSSTSVTAVSTSESTSPALLSAPGEEHRIANSHDSSTTADTDCHCPVHRTPCCQFSYSLQKENNLHTLSSQELSSLFAECVYSVKPAPFIDGPFQPPRS
ncbi:MAG: hypothetical protein AAGB31_13040 [Bdellovibrio sp.]